MDARIQFRIDEETKRLAQLMAESQGRTLSDACRELAHDLAQKQREATNRDTWLTDQVNRAFAKLDAKDAVFIPHDDAKTRMEDRKRRIRDKAQK